MVLSIGNLLLFCLLCLNSVAILNQQRFLARCNIPALPFFIGVSSFIRFLIPPNHPFTIAQMDLLLLAILPSNCVFLAESFCLHAALASPLCHSFLTSCSFDYHNTDSQPTGWKHNVTLPFIH
jgi:hypothetical protein